MNSTLRIARFCNPTNVWARQVDNGTEWFGLTSSIIQDIQKLIPDEDIKFIVDLPKNQRLPPSIQAIAEGTVDMDADNYFMTWDRYQLVDFSFPVEFFATNIVASSKYYLTGELVGGVFDPVSYGLIAVSIVLFALLLNLLKSKANFLESLLTCLGLSLNQGLGNTLERSDRNGVSKTLIIILSIFIYSITLMYSSVVTSMLTASKQMKIEALDQLTNEYFDVKIFWSQYSYESSALKTTFEQLGLKDRLDLFDPRSPEDVEKIFRGVRDRTHVFVGPHQFFVGNYLHNLETFRAKFPIESYRISKNTLSMRYVAWIFKKNFEHKELFERQVLLRHAHGLMNFRRAFWETRGFVRPEPLTVKCTPPSSETINFLRKFSILNRNGVESSERNITLGLTHLRQLFMFWAAGIAIASLTFIVEVLRAKWLQRNDTITLY